MTELYEKSLRTLELPKICQMLADEAVSQNAKNRALALVPYENIVECEKAQADTAAAVYLSGMLGSPYFGGVFDVTEAIKRADMGGVLNNRELLMISSLLACARSAKKYIESNKSQKTAIDGMFDMVSGNKFLEDKITNAILSDDEISDGASAELGDIRRTMRRASGKVKDVLNKIITSQAYSKMLQDPIVTIRSDRYVVPIKSEYKSSFSGLVHDMSSSGATLFIEPLSVVEINNEIKALAAREKKEIERILYELSADVAQFMSTIMADYNVLCTLDFIFSKAKLAYKMSANAVRLEKSGETQLYSARHPLLEQKTAVPITIKIGGENDTIIITGPNTGGKTVSIKTIGLLTAMAQCGLHIPAADGSTVVVKRRIYADIGDEQSIEQSLSTFSSHMRNIVHILGEADSDSLVLLDELGAGTDPVEGAALAIAIIEYLRALGSNILATTHYAELKIFALETPHVENASCEFDVATLKPTYRLLFGIPGKSNAFAISEKLGLPTHIVEQAKLKINSQNKKFEEVITRLEEKRQALEGNITKAEIAKRNAEEQSAAAKTRLQNIDAEREKLLSRARDDAQEIIKSAKRAAESALDEISRIKRENVKNANYSEARAQLRGQLNEAQRQTMGEPERVRAEALIRPLVAGDVVKMVRNGIKATVLKTPKENEKVQLQAGIMRVTVPQDELELIDEKPPESKLVGRVQMPKGGGSGKTELDLRGKNSDEALSELDMFIDDALRSNLPFATIIHGKGTGVLRQSVHKHLKGMKCVKSFRLGAYGEGDAGVTVITF